MEENEEKVVVDNNQNKETSQNIDNENKMKRRFCLTINNPTQTDEELEEYTRKLEHFGYYIFQREKGNKTGTEHIQMYLTFTSPKRFSTVKSYFPTAHIEPAKGSGAQNRDYCSKSDTRVSGPYEYGKFTDQGQRTDIDDFKELVYSGVDEYTLSELMPKSYFKYHKLVPKLLQNKIIHDHKDKRREDIQVVFIYGDSRSGKTSCILDKFGDSNVFRVTDYKRDPWDGYIGQDIVIFDDYRGEFDIGDILRYLDVYNLQLSSRFNNKLGVYTKVFFTTNKTYFDIFGYLKNTDFETYKAVEERIQNILRFTKGKIYLEKVRDKSLKELRELLPEKIIERIDKSKLNNQISYEEIESEQLPF